MEKISELENGFKVIDKKVDDLAIEKNEIKDKLKRSNVRELELKDVSTIIVSSKSVEDLDKCLDDMEYGFVKEDSIKDDVDGYYCRICFDNSKPNWDVQSSGAFKFDVLGEGGSHQSRQFINLKNNIKIHLNSKSHMQKKQLIMEKDQRDLFKKSREEIVGMNVFRERYQGIKQGKNRVDFEEDMLKAKLNGLDVGDINHSRKFAKSLDDAIYDEVKYNIKKNMEMELDATKKKRPAGLLMDKMTPNRRTGQIHAVVVPVPENPLSQNLLKAVMLEVPPVPNLSAEGLATTAKKVFNEAGLQDEQLEGIGWDGEYVKKGVKGKLLDLLYVFGMNRDEMDIWITQVWEPAHQLELTTKDIKSDPLFAWFVDHIQILNDTTNILGIGKGLEQSIEAAEEVGEKFYKLRNMSDTRFSAYFEGSISNFEKRNETNIAALRKRTESTDKKVKEKASSLLNKICNKQFFLLNLGILDIYRLLGSVSSLLQTVEQFPWDIPKRQDELLDQLKKMMTLKLCVDEQGEVQEVDQSLWERLGEKLEDILDDQYVSVQTVLSPGGRRMGRTGDDISKSQAILATVENRLKSLVKNLVVNLEKRLKNNPTPGVIMDMKKCLDLQDILDIEETEDARESRKRSLNSLLQKATYDELSVKHISEQYEVFKERFKDMAAHDGEHKEIVKRFEHLIFKTHSCTSEFDRDCTQKRKLVSPRVPEVMKFLHLFLKEPVLYDGLHDFLHFFLRYTLYILVIIFVSQT